MNKIAECNLRYDIINHPKLTKILNIHYYPIIHGCMNTRNGRSKFKNFRILFESGCSYTIGMIRLIEFDFPKKDAVMICHRNASNIITNIKVKTDYTLPGLRVA